SGYPAHRKAAFEGLARSGGAGAAAPRIEAAMASEKDTRVLTAMAFALATAGREGVNRVLDALADRDRSDDALSYLVELGRPIVAAVAARFSDPDPFVRGQIATALGFIGGPEAVAALKGASGESDPDVRQRIDTAQLRLARTPATPARVPPHPCAPARRGSQLRRRNCAAIVSAPPTTDGAPSSLAPAAFPPAAESPSQRKAGPMYKGCAVLVVLLLLVAGPWIGGPRTARAA